MRKKITSSVSKCYNIVVYFLAFILVGTLIYIMLVPKSNKLDMFQVSNGLTTSRTLYQRSNNYEQDLKTLYSTLGDNDDMLMMASCYQLPPNSRSMIPADCLREEFTLYTASFEDVRSRIIGKLNDLKSQNKGQLLEAPAFVLIEQSPYMRDEAGNVITMQYNVRSYNLSPVNLMKRGASSGDLGKPLFFRITIFLTKYFNNFSMRPSALDLKMALLPYKSKKDQCYISCIGDVTKSYCGCLNREQDTADTSSYAAKCSATPLPVNGQINVNQNVPADFAILYSINTKASVLLQTKVFND